MKIFPPSALSSNFRACASSLRVFVLRTPWQVSRRLLMKKWRLCSITLFRNSNRFDLPLILVFLDQVVMLLIGVPFFYIHRDSFLLAGWGEAGSACSSSVFLNDMPGSLLSVIGSQLCSLRGFGEHNPSLKNIQSLKWTSLEGFLKDNPSAVSAQHPLGTATMTSV